MNLPSIDAVARYLHGAAQTTNTGAEPRMPFEQLPEVAKNDLRNYVRAVYAGIDACTVDQVRVQESPEEASR